MGAVEYLPDESVEARPYISEHLCPGGMNGWSCAGTLRLGGPQPGAGVDRGSGNAVGADQRRLQPGVTRRLGPAEPDRLNTSESMAKRSCSV